MRTTWGIVRGIGGREHCVGEEDYMGYCRGRGRGRGRGLHGLRGMGAFWGRGKRLGVGDIVVKGVLWACSFLSTISEGQDGMRVLIL